MIGPDLHRHCQAAPLLQSGSKVATTDAAADVATDATATDAIITPVVVNYGSVAVLAVMPLLSYIS